MSRQFPQGEEMDMDGRGAGWKTFASIMLMIVGVMNVFDGLVAITHTNYIRRHTGGVLPVTNDVKVWGWIALIIGVIIILAAFGVLAGTTWARVVGIIVASLNLLFQFAWLDHSALWGFTMIVVDILIIYGLAAHGGPEYQEA
jgi:hypothetical protein